MPRLEQQQIQDKINYSSMCNSGNNTFKYAGKIKTGIGILATLAIQLHIYKFL